MGKQVTVKSGYSRVALTDGKVYDAGQMAVLSDAHFAMLQSSVLSLLTVGSTVADPTPPGGGGGGGGGGATGGLQDPFPSHSTRSSDSLVIHVPNIADGTTYTLPNPAQASLLNIETGDYMSIQPVAKGLYSVQARVYLSTWNTLVGKVVNVWVYTPFGDATPVAADPFLFAQRTDPTPFFQTTRELGLWPILRDSDLIYPESASLTDYVDYTGWGLGTVGFEITLRPVLVL